MKYILGISAAALVACTPVYETMSRAEAVAMCREQAAESAQVVSGNASVGVNSISGPSFGLGIGINLTPRPQAQTFEQCMADLAAHGQIVEDM